MNTKPTVDTTFVNDLTLTLTPTEQKETMSKPQNVMLLAALTLVFLFGIAGTILGQGITRPEYDTYYPSHAKGYVNHPFEGSEFDNINLYNGNLTASIPLGPTLHAGGDVKLQLALQYNSKIWDQSRKRVGGCTGAHCDRLGLGTLQGTVHAGLGWTLELGHISYAEGGLTLHTADGGQHELFPSRFGAYWEGGPDPGPKKCSIQGVGDFCYTRDGTDIKVGYPDEGDGYVASFPDGTVRLYTEKLTTNTRPDRDFSRNSGTYCTKIEDRWGNHIDITYASETYNASHDGKVIPQLIPDTIEEIRADGTYLRKVEFIREQPNSTLASLKRPFRITAVRFYEAEPNSNTIFLTYQLNYLSYNNNDSNLDRLQLMSYYDEYWHSSEFDWANNPVARRKTDWVYLLAGVRISGANLLDPIRYGFRYNTCATDNGEERDDHVECTTNIDVEDVFTCDVPYQCRNGNLGAKIGVLRQAELPTGAVIEFDYETWMFNHHHQEQDIDTGGNVQYAIHGRWNEGGNIACPGCNGGVPPVDEPPLVKSLGVNRRIVYGPVWVPDETEGVPIRKVIARKDISQQTDYKMLLPVHFDAGYPDVPNPKKGFPDESAAENYYTSWSKTTVTNYSVADETGTPPISTEIDPKPEIGIPARDDESVYYFSLGPTAQENRDDLFFCMSSNTEKELFTLPLAGALIYEQHFRGSADGIPERTTAYSYTVDDHAHRIGWEEAGPRFGTQHNRRKRAVITYYHGAAADSKDLVNITRYGYETDRCATGSTLCSQSLGETPDSFANHTVLVESQSTFDSRSFTLPATPSCGTLGFELFGPLQDAIFDTTTKRTYWKGELGYWLLSRPGNEHVARDGLPTGSVAVQEQAWDYDSTYGNVIEKRLLANPGSGESNNDVVTRYEYVGDSGTNGYGQVQVVQTGFASQMGDPDWTERFPDDSTFFAYDENETVYKQWKVCHQHQADNRACDGWTDPDDADGPGLLAELQVEVKNDPGFRKPTYGVDANGDGVATIEYDAIGRPIYMYPTSDEVAETYLDYPTMNVTEVELENDDPDGPRVQVARYQYDRLGRIKHVMQRLPRPGTEGAYRNKTFQFDGVGNQWWESDWAEFAYFNEDDKATRALTFDPFGVAEHTIASDGSGVYTFFSGPRRVESLATDTDGTTVLKRTITYSDARGNTLKVLEDREINCTSPDPVDCTDTENTDDFIISSYSYDVADRLTGVTVSGTEGSQSRSFTYNELGFLNAETHPELSDQVSYGQYDALGRAGRVIKPGNMVFESLLDAAGRPLKTEVTVNGSGPWLYSEISYGTESTNPVTHPNPIGKPLQVTQYNPVTSWAAPTDSNQDGVVDSAVAVSHTYFYEQPQGLLSRRETLIDSLVDGTDDAQLYSLEYEHDLWANVSSIVYPDSGDGDCLPVDPPQVDYRWDPSGLLGISRFVDATTSECLLCNVNYDTATGMMNQWSTPVGIDVSPLSYLVHEVTPDGTRARPKRIKASSGGAVFDTGEFFYDGVGNILDLAGSPQTPAWSYTYDALSRLASARRHPGSTEEEKRQYKYDDFGNITSRLFEGSATWQDVEVSAATNRLNGTGIDYDDSGNVVTEPAGSWSRRLRFDPNNRLMAAWATGTGEPPDTYAFAYDAAGERVLRYRIQDSVVQGASFYLRDEAGNVLSEFLWSPDGQGSGSLTRISDNIYLGRKPIVQLAYNGNDTTYTSLVHDQLSTTRAEVTDANTWNTFDYWPYGEIVEGQSQSAQSHLFTAHEREYTGEVDNALQQMDYMHARYYTHNLGRFVSVDPLGGAVGSSQSWNRYSYVSNNPLTLVDPTGMKEEVEISCSVGEQCTGPEQDLDAIIRAEEAETARILAAAKDLANSPDVAHEIAELVANTPARERSKLGLALSLGLTAEGGASDSGSGSLFLNYVHSSAEGSSFSITYSDSLGEQFGTPVGGLSAEFQFIGIGFNNVSELAANRYLNIGVDAPFVGGEVILDQSGQFTGFNLGLELLSGGAGAVYARESKHTVTLLSIQ
ncbi:MAG: RHS repeat-associated core domain-containing protein [bacterium]|nr:RHS repeat-associated core domain-containing protein [bacterium]